MPDKIDLDQLHALMEQYNVPSKGKTLCGHFTPAEAVELLALSETRILNLSKIIVAATKIGLPSVKEMFPVVAPEDREEPSRLCRGTPTITPELKKLMAKYNVSAQGQTLCGHFAPAEAVDVLHTAETRNRSIGSIVKLAVKAGLPQVKKRYQAAKPRRTVRKSA